MKISRIPGGLNAQHENWEVGKRGALGTKVIRYMEIWARSGMRLKLSCHCNGISYGCIVSIPPHAQTARNNSLNKNQPGNVILRWTGLERGYDMLTVHIIRFLEKSLLSKPLRRQLTRTTKQVDPQKILTYTAPVFRLFSNPVHRLLSAHEYKTYGRD